MLPAEVLRPSPKYRLKYFYLESFWPLFISIPSDFSNYLLPDTSMYLKVGEHMSRTAVVPSWAHSPWWKRHTKRKGVTGKPVTLQAGHIPLGRYILPSLLAVAGLLTRKGFPHPGISMWLSSISHTSSSDPTLSIQNFSFSSVIGPDPLTKLMT